MIAATDIAHLEFEIQSLHQTMSRMTSLLSLAFERIQAQEVTIASMQQNVKS